MKIQARISLIIFLIILVTGAIAIIISRSVSTNIVKRQIYSHLETTAKSRANHINTFLVKGKECIVQLSNSIVIEKLLKANKYSKDYKKIFNDVMIRLKYSKIVFKDVYDVFILDRNGIIIASSNKSDIGKDKSSDSNFLGGKQGAFIRDAYFSKTIKKNCLAFSAPVFSKQDNKFLGVVVKKYSLEPLNIITQDRIGLGRTGEIYLLNKDNYMITPSRFMEDTFLKYKVDTSESREWLELTEEEEKKEREEIDIYQGYTGKMVIGTHYKINEMNWCLLAELCEEEAFAPVTRLTYGLLIILVILLASGIITSVFVARTFTAPIIKLRKGTDEIINGNLDYKVGTNAKDEIGLLSRAFDKMTANMKKNRDELEEYSKSLEKKVEERTIKLEEHFKTSDQQRIATLNIASDLEQINIQLTKEIEERRKAEEELQKHLKELEVFYQATMGRESRIVELKKEINLLLERLGGKNKFRV
ncbi:MAG: HAMP domain-containing protein [Candidatus Cloacimonetes bacterium]|nr:HAMP domain-containing protein [Candidatus Cloacimonadota bacterium]